MILKQLRLQRLLSQEQLAQMSGLSVRTIQRIESGQSPSVESLKCLASVLEVDVATINHEKFMIDKKSDSWQRIPLWMKWWFFLNIPGLRPTRAECARGEVISHVSGFLFCVLGWVSQPALAGGLIMLLMAYFFRYSTWLCDKYGLWYESEEVN